MVSADGWRHRMLRYFFFFAPTCAVATTRKNAMSQQDAKQMLVQAYEQVLKAYAYGGYPTQEDDNFRETAERAAKAAQEMVRPVAEIESEISDLLQRRFRRATTKWSSASTTSVLDCVHTTCCR